MDDEVSGTIDQKLITNIVAQVCSQILPMIFSSLGDVITAGITAALENRNDDQDPRSQNEIKPLLSNLQKQSLLLKYEQDKLDQMSRRECIRVYNIPERDGEDTLQVFIDFLKNRLDITATRTDLSYCYRSGPRQPTKSRAILVKFISKNLKDQVMQAKKKLRLNEDGNSNNVHGQNGKGKEVFIAEDLTPLRFKLMLFAKKQENVKKVYTRDGKVICILKQKTMFDKEEVVVIENPDDLFKLGVGQPDLKDLGLGMYDAM